MNIAQMREFLLYCTAINYGFLLLWWAMLALAHDGLYRLIKVLMGRSFTLSAERMDEMQFGWIGFYKIGVFLFNLVPCIALHLIH